MNVWKRQIKQTWDDRMPKWERCCFILCDGCRELLRSGISKIKMSDGRPFVESEWQMATAAENLLPEWFSSPYFRHFLFPSDVWSLSTNAEAFELFVSSLTLWVVWSRSMRLNIYSIELLILPPSAHSKGVGQARMVACRTNANLCCGRRPIRHFLSLIGIAYLIWTKISSWFEWFQV